MIYNFKEILEVYGSVYNLNKEIKAKNVYKLEEGLYSREEYIDPILLLTKKYEDGIITMDTAFYLYNLTDYIPEEIHFARKHNSYPVKQYFVKQYFLDNKIFELGKTQIDVDGTLVNIYDKEKLLIELIKRKKNISFDYYKEIINNYRKIGDKLDINKIEEYLEYYKNKDKIFETIQKEVF